MTETFENNAIWLIFLNLRAHSSFNRIRIPPIFAEMQIMNEFKHPAFYFSGARSKD